MKNNISPSAVIESGVEIGENCSVGAFTIVREGTKLGANSEIGNFCEIGVATPLAKSPQLVIGENCKLRSGTTIYTGSRIGNNFISGHQVMIRENTLIGDDVRIGTFSDIQGDCKIGNFTRFHSSVHVGKYSEVGSFVWIFPYVVLTNDPLPPSKDLVGVWIQDFAVIAAMSTILPGVIVGFGSLIGANSLVQQDVPMEVLALGSPARIIKPVQKIRNNVNGLSAYPWVQHYTDGYPDDMALIYANLRKTYTENGLDQR